MPAATMSPRSRPNYLLIRNDKEQIKDLWDKLPIFRDSMDEVPTIHVPNKKELIRTALSDSEFMENTKCDPSVYSYPC